ncbi:FUSC family protein [Methanobrevibacter sp.]|uniref:FUSC family protein n=1 Tax=Methanobrevibacter sp. TaxID=66852 RepID=UPI0026DF6FFB|nr:FUSC family protein [Methanobrevibacter sp.]
MFFYMSVFGNKNAVIGVTMVMATFMNLGNDLSFKPKTSFIKILLLLLVLGLASFLNNPLTLWGCILTFLVVFGTTFTSYHLFGTSVYLPFLMCYFMMVGIPISLEDLPMRLLSLVFGAIFIVGLNIVINKKKTYKLSKATITTLINELNNAIDLKLNGEEVSIDNFKTVSGFYLSIFNKFEYKLFPTKTQQSVLDVVKSFQYIGRILSEFDLSKNELLYLKDVLSQIRNINPKDIFHVEIESEGMPLALLNLEIIANETKKDLTNEAIIPDKKTLFSLFKPMIKRQFSFRSVKFTFAFKMAFILFIWQLLTLIFNLPFTKWLYFATIPLMLPYINDVEYTARSRLHGTLIGVFIFAIIMLMIPYINLSFNVMMMIVMIICMMIMVVKLEDKLILAIVTTIMSVMTALMYIEPPEAMFLKVLWVAVAVLVVTLFNYKFLPYSVEIETKNNLKASFGLNLKSINLIKQKCINNDDVEKTTVLVVSNIIRENIEVTDENDSLNQLQIKITDICNFILNCLNFNEILDELAENLVNIIDNGSKIDDNLNFKDKIIAYCMDYVMKLYEEENEIMEELYG